LPCGGVPAPLKRGRDTTAGMQELEQRRERLPRVGV